MVLLVTMSCVLVIVVAVLIAIQLSHRCQSRYNPLRLHVAS
jgi:hypothetical protein